MWIFEFEIECLYKKEKWFGFIYSLLGLFCLHCVHCIPGLLSDKFKLSYQNGGGGSGGDERAKLA